MIFKIWTNKEKAIVIHKNSDLALLEFCSHSEIDTNKCSLIKEITLQEAIEEYSNAHERIENQQIAMTLLSQHNHFKYAFICSFWL